MSPISQGGGAERGAAQGSAAVELRGGSRIQNPDRLALLREDSWNLECFFFFNTTK